jgi:glycosyltransferase involved in cell wall biosynthesis
MEKLVTFFTPTYNRAHILTRCYESLCSQSSFNFKWLIVDDGSSDNTKELAEKWIEQEDRFEIRYIYKENGGLHTAFNVAVEETDTELFVCFESDDIFAPEAMTIIESVWSAVRDSDCVGFITLCRDMDGNLIGRTFPEDVKTTLYREHRRIAPGDKQYVFRTAALRRVFPMPSFPGEKYFDPKYRFFALDEIGPLAVTNEVFDIVDYQPGGLTRTMMRQYYNSPNSFAEYRKLYMQLPNRSKKYVMKQNIHYVASCCLAGKLSRAVAESPRKGYTLLALVPGVLWAGVIRHANRDKAKGEKK